jgi:hypothetical protein
MENKRNSSDFVSKSAVKMSVFRIFQQRYITVPIRLYHRTDVNVASLSIFSPIWLINCPVYHFIPILLPNRTVLFAKIVGNRQVYVDPVGSYFSIFIDLVCQFF